MATLTQINAIQAEKVTISLVLISPNRRKYDLNIDFYDSVKKMFSWSLGSGPGIF
jgi:hypothetical protein